MLQLTNSDKSRTFVSVSCTRTSSYRRGHRARRLSGARCFSSLSDHRREGNVDSLSDAVPQRFSRAAARADDARTRDEDGFSQRLLSSRRDGGPGPSS